MGLDKTKSVLLGEGHHARILEDISRLYVHCYLVTVTVYVFPVYSLGCFRSLHITQTNKQFRLWDCSGTPFWIRVIAPINFTNEPVWGSTGKHCCLVIRPGYAVVLRSLEGVQSDLPVLRKVP